MESPAESSPMLNAESTPSLVEAPPLRPFAAVEDLLAEHPWKIVAVAIVAFGVVVSLLPPAGPLKVQGNYHYEHRKPYPSYLR